MTVYLSDAGGGLEPVLTQLGAGYSLSWSRLGTMVAFEAPGGVTA